MIVKKRHSLQRDYGRSSTQVASGGVQDLHGVLKLQLLVQSHDAGFRPVVPDKDPPHDLVVELLKSVGAGTREPWTWIHELLVGIHVLWAGIQEPWAGIQELWVGGDREQKEWDLADQF